MVSNRRWVLELLATVDWLIEREHCSPTLGGIREGLAQWPGGHTAAARKQRIFTDRLISLALERQQEFQGAGRRI